MKKILVTGAAGFIGRQALPLLAARGYEVHGIILPGWEPIREVPVQWHEANLFDPGGREQLLASVQPTHLLHLAWCTAPATYRTSDDNLAWVAASVDLARKFVEYGGRRAVFAGTCFEYDSSQGCRHELSTPCRPDTLYGTCKNALRQIVEDFFSRKDIPAAWGRIFYLFGPNEYRERLVPAVITALLKKEPARCTAGTQLRDFLYVADVADAFAALLESDVRGPVNIGSGAPIAVKDLVLRIGELLGSRDLIRLGERPTPAGEPPLVCADVGRLRNEVGWQPAHSLDQGLELTIEWWRRNLTV